MTGPIRISYNKPTVRNADGWYEDPEPIPSKTVLVPSAIRPLTEFRYRVEENHLEDDWFTYRKIKVWWVSTGPKRIWARGGMSLFGCRDITASNSDVMCALDSGSQESFDFGELLATTYRDPIAQLFHYARHVANFTMLEVRGDLCGRGLGIQVGKQLIATIQRRFDVGITILKPFPLQYTGALPPRDAVEYDEVVDREFRKSRFRLARRYAKNWGAIRLPGSRDHMLVPGTASDRGTLVLTRHQWYIE